MSKSARAPAEIPATAHRAHKTETEPETTPLTVRLLDALEHTDAVADRADGEAYEFRVVAPMLIEVTNTSYDRDAHDAHRYTVTIADTGGLFVPIHCSCAFYHYRSDDHGACKHMVATVTKGGPPLLGASAVYTGSDRRASDDDVTTAADLLSARDSE